MKTSFVRGIEISGSEAGEVRRDNAALPTRSRRYGRLATCATSSGMQLLAVTILVLFSAFYPRAQDSKPVSFFKDVVPIFKRSCTGCHHPGKMKADLDLTTYAAFQKGGKHGASFTSGDPKKSLVIEEISGDEPSMPKEGDALTKAEVALIERWIAEGAKDDTPADAFTKRLKEPPAYQVPPVLSAIVYSPDGTLMAVSGYHEVLLHKADGSELVGRLLGESPRIESCAFSPDGKLLAVSGCAPALYGEIQIWNVAEKSLVRSVKTSTDALYGVSFSPEGSRIAFGCADKTVRMINVADGKEILKFDNHSDWVLATTFTVDGKRLLSGGRDKAMKLIDASNGQFIDDINKLLEGVFCMARHPKKDEVAYGGELGTPRIYKISDNQGRTAANNDVNLIKQFERHPGPVQAIAYSPDGESIALGGTSDEVRIYKLDGSRVATLKGHEGAIFTIAFHPSRKELATGGYDGKVRLYETESGRLMTTFVPVPIKPVQQASIGK